MKVVNWKTTATGLIGAILIVISGWLQTGNLHDWRTLATAIVAAAIGVLAKDAGVKEQ